MAPAIGVGDAELRRRGELAVLARIHRAADIPEPIDQLKLLDGRVLVLGRLPKELRESVQSAVVHFHTALSLDETVSARQLVEQAIRNAELVGSYNNAIIDEAEAALQTAAEVRAARASNPGHADLMLPQPTRERRPLAMAYRP